MRFYEDFMAKKPKNVFLIVLKVDLYVRQINLGGIFHLVMYFKSNTIINHIIFGMLLA